MPDWLALTFPPKAPLKDAPAGDEGRPPALLRAAEGNTTGGGSLDFSVSYSSSRSSRSRSRMIFRTYTAAEACLSKTIPDEAACLSSRVLT